MTTTIDMGYQKNQKECTEDYNLHLEDVDIILYEFTLIKLGHFIKSTINILNEKLKFMNSK